MVKVLPKDAHDLKAVRRHLDYMADTENSNSNPMTASAFRGGSENSPGRLGSGYR